ncbi:MFS transporter [Nocardioides terrisoli]|uniref:MFS transporter n=1 Tax=Nocardioides terrisoli TaxID=3388267 RepID=UPI00287B8DB9|nr:MFS transporter [Nocardioides marmorisolisilvae]
MLNSYRRVLTARTTLMSGTGILARLPISMMTLGIVVVVSAGYGSYGLAGQVSAAYIVGNAVLAVVQGRLADRFGQRPVLAVDAVFFGASTGMLVRAVTEHAATPWPQAWAALCGATIPPVGSLVRARWAHLMDDEVDRHTAFALESVGDEVVYVAGPTLVTLLSTVYAPQTGLLVALVVGTAGPLALAVQRRTEPPTSRRDEQRTRGSIPWAVMTPLTLAAAALGALFGAMEVATVAFAADEGHRAVSGLLLAALSLASMIAGLLTGARRSVLPLASRMRMGMTVLTLGFLVLPFVGSLWLLGTLMFLAGFAIAPTLIAMISLVEVVTPRSRLTEAMAWVQTGLAAGIAPGAWLAGVVADDAGGSDAFWVCVAAGLVAVAGTWATRPPALSSPA